MLLIFFSWNSKSTHSVAGNSSLPSSFWNLTDVWTLNLSSNYLSGRLSPSWSIWKPPFSRLVDVQSHEWWMPPLSSLECSTNHASIVKLGRPPTLHHMPIKGSPPLIVKYTKVESLRAFVRNREK
ncbi:hypothetical protein ACS0TY_003102 [Phlomoides rotata]